MGKFRVQYWFRIGSRSGVTTSSGFKNLHYASAISAMMTHVGRNANGRIGLIQLRSCTRPILRQHLQSVGKRMYNSGSPNSSELVVTRVPSVSAQWFNSIQHSSQREKYSDRDFLSYTDSTSYAASDLEVSKPHLRPLSHSDVNTNH